MPPHLWTAPSSQNAESHSKDTKMTGIKDKEAKNLHDKGRESRGERKNIWQQGKKIWGDRKKIWKDGKQIWDKGIEQPLKTSFKITSFVAIVASSTAILGSLVPNLDNFLDLKAIDVLEWIFIDVSWWIAIVAATIATELFFAILLIVLIDRWNTRKQEQARGPVHENAFTDAIDIFGDIHQLLCSVMKESNDEGMTNSIKLNDKYGDHLRKEIERIYIESDNYLQRFNAFLSANETGKSGSDLLDCISRIRRILKQIDKTIKKQQRDQDDTGVRIQLKAKVIQTTSGETTDEPTSKKIQLFLQIGHTNMYLGFLGELNDLTENVITYYRYIKKKDAMFRRDDDNFLSLRDELPLSAGIEDPKSYTWTRRLLENARRRLDELFAGPQVWECLKTNGSWDSLDTFKAKSNGYNPILGIRAAWTNLGIHYRERSYPTTAEKIRLTKAADKLIQIAAEEGDVFAMRVDVLANLEDAIEEWIKCYTAKLNKKHYDDAAKLERNLEKLDSYLEKPIKEVAVTEKDDETEKYLKYLKKLLREDDVQVQTKIGAVYRCAAKVLADNETAAIIAQEEEIVISEISKKKDHYAKRALHWLEQASKKNTNDEAIINICEMGEIDGFYDNGLCDKIQRWTDNYDSYLEKCRSASRDPGSSSVDLSARASFLLAFLLFRKVNERKSAPDGDSKQILALLYEAAAQIFALYEAAADRGHVEAQKGLAELYAYGRLHRHHPLSMIDGRSADDGQAARWLRKVVESSGRSDERSKLHLSEMYVVGSSDEWTKLFLAKMYVEGRLSADDERAVGTWLCGKGRDLEKWKNGESEDADILYVLGAALRDGIYFHQCDNQAKKYFMKKLDEHGECDHPGILNRLGMMYRDGHSGSGGNGEIVVSLDDAKRYFDMAACHHNVHHVYERGSAAVNLGDLFCKGCMYTQGEDMDKTKTFEGFRWTAGQLRRDVEPKVLLSYVTISEWISEVIDEDRVAKSAIPASAPRGPLQGAILASLSPSGRPIGGISRAYSGVAGIAVAKSEWVTHSIALCYKGIMYEEGWGNQIPEEEEAEKHFRVAAAIRSPGEAPDYKELPGHVLAKYRLGRMYERRAKQSRFSRDDQKKAEVKKLLEKAEHWYLDAASLQEDGTAGHPQAQYRLGRMYDHQRKYDQAEEWYRKAARKRDGVSGHPRAQYQLGLMYECMFEQDEVAKNWYLEASKPRWYDKKGHADAQYRLGQMYRDERGGLELDPARAKEYFCKAAGPRWYDQKRCAKALYALAEVIKRQEGKRYFKCVVYTDEVLEYYRQAADQGHMKAAYELGRAYEMGWLEGRDGKADRSEIEVEKIEEWLDCKQNVDEAVSIYHQLADNQNHDAKVRHDAGARLWRLYLGGWNGRAPNVEMGKKWLIKAAAGGEKEALDRVWREYRYDDSVRTNRDVLYEFGRRSERLAAKVCPPQDEQKRKTYLEDAEKRYLDAHKQGHSGAPYQLAMLYKKELDQERDLSGYYTASYPLEKASSQPYKYSDKDERFVDKKEHENPSLDPKIWKIYKLGIKVKYWLLKAADQNHKDAQYELADVIKGRGHYTNRAVDYYCRAARLGHAEAAYELGCAYEKGWLLEIKDGGRKGAPSKEEPLEERLKHTRDVGKAVEWYHEAAVRGQFRALNALGRLYWQGWDGQAQDRARAMTYFQRALACAPFADPLKVKEEDRGPEGTRYLNWSYHWGDFEGLAEADVRYQLGLMWENGYGWRPKNWRSAKDWYCIVDRFRPDLHSSEASYRLGCMYEEGGHGLQEDRRKARDWYERARGSGDTPSHPSAEYRLGCMYYDGMEKEGEGSDWRNAAARYESYLGAVDSRADDAQNSIDRPKCTVGRDGDPTSRMASKSREEEGEPTPSNVEYRLAVMYQEGGHGLDKDESKALELMVRAAEHGNEKAMDWWDEKVSSLLKEDKAKKDGQDGQH